MCDLVFPLILPYRSIGLGLSLRINTEKELMLFVPQIWRVFCSVLEQLRFWTIWLRDLPSLLKDQNYGSEESLGSFRNGGNFVAFCYWHHLWCAATVPYFLIYFQGWEKQHTTKKGLNLMNPKWLFLLVAGPRFELGTFGLWARLPPKS